MAFATKTERFTKLFVALVKSTGGWLSMLNDTAKVKGGPRAGAVTARITTTPTLQDIEDGTMASNNAARTEVSLTGFRKQHPISLHEDELDQFDRDAEVAEIKAFAGAANVHAEGLVCAELISGSPGDTVTLPTGNIDLATDGSSGEAYDVLVDLEEAITYVEANTAGKEGEVFILLNTDAYKNLKALRKFDRVAADLTRQGTQWYYQNYPVFTTTYSTSFGGASNPAGWVIHKDAYALNWWNVYMPHEDFRHYGDGVWKLFLKTFGFYGLIQESHYAEILNPAT